MTRFSSLSLRPGYFAVVFVGFSAIFIVTDFNIFSFSHFSLKSPFLVRIVSLSCRLETAQHVQSCFTLRLLETFILYHSVPFRHFNSLPCSISSLLIIFHLLFLPISFETFLLLLICAF